MHCVRLTRDGLVYVCDRVNNRVQVFRLDVTYVRTLDTTGTSSPAFRDVYGVAVAPGGEAALACLKKNEATLSAACRSAVSAIGGSPAAAPASATAAVTPAAAPAAPAAAPVPNFPPLMEARILRRFCSMDFATLCKGVQLGQGRALQCLAQNAEALSPGCKQAMATATR